ncbi:MAG: aspartate/tyrosine/aromatic aminotransferase [Candidatus Omnitrophica bacterium]|nr:Aspartate aminotransferase [bacterium]NUN95380.1 aspartate/tyrosine/aromatic aminotransferase [Candidatus Omnitrophota bacterium]
MFESIPMAKPDAILGLTEAFKKDPNPSKINLSVGVYKDNTGNTPIFASVKKAEERLLAAEKSKSYLSIEGSKEYGDAVQALLFGKDHEILASKRAATAHTPGGTGGLRVAADFLKAHFPGATVWLSDPTWPNHPNVFQAAGLACKTYPYFDFATNTLTFDKLLEGLRAVPKGDVVLLHACCHNPTGVDPTAAQWKAIADVLAERGALPFFDFAYQGLAKGLSEDAAGVLELARPGVEMLIASSFSKNFGLYNERVGALTVVAGNSDPAEKAMSQIKSCIRANYSNPSFHGGAIVTTILNDPSLRAEWEGEVTAMRNRINGMRKTFVETLKAKGVGRDFSFIAGQTGMFSFSGLSPEQVERLKKEYGIYIVGNGRINVAGMTDSNVGVLCDAIAKVL